MTPKVSRSSNEPLLGAASSWIELLTNHSQNASTMESSSSSEGSNSREIVQPRRTRKTRATNAKAPAKKRRTTYDIRKQQKSDLVAEVARLEKQLELLKHRILLQQGEANTTIRRTEAANSVLHESAREQHVAIAGIQGMLVSHMQQTLSSLHPTHSFIRLGTDRVERRATLMAMKGQKLREAKRFVEAWDQDLDTESTVSQENRFESLDGGFSVVRFDNAPLPSTTVKAVFDAITHSMQNAEIIISELFGSITIREDTEFEAADISQLRLVSSTSHGATVESNSVVFAEFVDTPEECFGIVVADFVDADELYPYRPAERVRRDAITLVLIRALPSHDYEKKVVVGTRWTCLKLAHSELDVPKEGLAELQESSMAWGDTMKKCILKHLAKSEAENGIKWT